MPTASTLITTLGWLLQEGFTKRWLMLAQTSSVLEGLFPYLDGLTTTSSFGFLVSTSSFTMLKKIPG
jgi:hypothetical protein